ncbi:MAG: homocysteine S-methyltransferase family protein, partial [Burkholderiales bacterium]
AQNRPVYIGGAVSNYGAIPGGDGAGRARMARGPRVGYWSEYPEYSEAHVKASMREQAQTLVEAGVDFLIAESTGTLKQREWVSEACAGLGVPFWVGFKSRIDKGVVKSGYVEDINFDSAIDSVLKFGGDVATVFHSSVEATSASIPILRQHWKGPIGVYPDASRSDYLARHGSAEDNATSVPRFVELAREWVGQGAQIVGGCCGFGPEYIAPLRAALPARISR